MSGHTKGRHTNSPGFIQITIVIPGDQKGHYQIPNTKTAKEKIHNFLRDYSSSREEHLVPWDEAIPWEEIAAKRVTMYTEQGLVLRGARLREGLSQKDLAKMSGISQDNLSRMENGKRVIGERTAKKLASLLKIDYKLLVCTHSSKRG